MSSSTSTSSSCLGLGWMRGTNTLPATRETQGGTKVWTRFPGSSPRFVPDWNVFASGQSSCSRANFSRN
ncbi:unnamed protein product [Ixodes pacificus]